MGIFHMLWALLVGLVVGATARFIMPGQEHTGLLMTAIVGVVGSFIGGFIGSLVSKPVEGSMFHPAGFIMSIIGALILLFLMGKIL